MFLPLQGLSSGANRQPLQQAKRSSVPAPAIRGGRKGKRPIPKRNSLEQRAARGLKPNARKKAKGKRYAV